jgi:hypothetical protein
MKQPQPTAEFSAHIQMAAMEIATIMQRYDIAGLAILHDPTGTKVVQRLDPTGTCSYMKGGAFGVKEPEAIAHVKDATERREVIFRTLNMVVNLRIMTTTVMVALQQAEGHVRKFFNLVPPPPGGPQNTIIK